MSAEEKGLLLTLAILMLCHAFLRILRTAMDLYDMDTTMKIDT
jgi:hypothetical protein